MLPRNSKTLSVVPAVEEPTRAELQAKDAELASRIAAIESELLALRNDVGERIQEDAVDRFVRGDYQPGVTVDVEGRRKELHGELRRLHELQPRIRARIHFAYLAELCDRVKAPGDKVKAALPRLAASLAALYQDLEAIRPTLLELDTMTGEHEFHRSMAFNVEGRSVPPFPVRAQDMALLNSWVNLFCGDNMAPSHYDVWLAEALAAGVDPLPGKERKS